MVQVTQAYWLAKVQELERALVQEKARHLLLQSELDSAQLRVFDSELELMRVKQKAQLRETELEMALDLVRSKAMAGWVMILRRRVMHSAPDPAYMRRP